MGHKMHKTAGEKIAGRIDPELMELKKKFENEYWELLHRKVKELNLNIDDLLFRDREGFLGRSCTECVSSCLDCVTGCDATCIVSAPI